MDEFKALTVINLPFTEKRFAPGKMISLAEIEEYVAAAKAAQTSDAGHVPDADEVISTLIEFGSLSDDPDAEVHPDHRPVDPNKPTVARLVELAKNLQLDLEERGEAVPSKLRALAEMDVQTVSSADEGYADHAATAGEAS